MKKEITTIQLKRKTLFKLNFIKHQISMESQTNLNSDEIINFLIENYESDEKQKAEGFVLRKD